MLTQLRVRELFRYDSEIGILTNRISRGSNAKKGNEAGTLHPAGYRYVRVDNKNYKTHRIIWLYLRGYFPENEIDHIDRNPSNNRIDNLREASRQCNARNAKKRCTNTSGVTGVSWNTQCQKWVVMITVNVKSYNLGYSKSKTEAVARRLAAEQCLDWPGCNSSSPAFQYMQNYLNQRNQLRRKNKKY